MRTPSSFRPWRASLSDAALAEAADKFRQIEKAAFDGDGFQPAVQEIAAIETALRIHDLDRYTAPAPGQASQGVLATPPALQEGAD